MEIYLVRHGESIANLGKILQGQLDSPLSPSGKEQASSLRGKLPKFDKVYCSPLQRAKGTAEIATSESPEVIEQLKEFYIGDLEGKLFSDLPDDRDEIMDYLFLQNNEYHSEINSESNKDFVKRTSSAFNNIIEQSSKSNYQKIAIFTHGGTMRAILLKYLKILTPQEAIFHNTDVIILEYDRERYVVKNKIINSY